MNIRIPENAGILISRTDSIGDVVLTIPITVTLKKLFPKNKIIFLCSSYTQTVLKYVDTIDEILVYDELKKLPKSQQKQIFSKHNIHTTIIVFPTYEISKFIYSMKVPVRIGTSHRWYNYLFCNHLVSFSRKNSNLHEAQLNFKLLKPLGITEIPSIKDITEMFHLKKIPPLPDDLKKLLDNNKQKIIIHPKSKGSAREWGTDNFIKLIELLNASGFQIIITGTKNEEGSLSEIFIKCPYVLSLVGKTDLNNMISLINECDALVANSTGVLHIAAIIGKLSIGLFPSIRPMHKERWGAIGKKAVNLNFKNESKSECIQCKRSDFCHCIQSIEPYQVFSIIRENLSN